MDAVILERVEKSFGEVQAVDGLSASVPSGSIYGFLGPNGAGKTTTLRMIMDIIRPDRGRIEILGSPTVPPVKKRIGYLPEERGLYRKMTVGRVLSYFGAIKGLSPGEVTRRVPRWLERVELSHCLERRVEELSRGMHQKLQFAVTCINEPDLLILDEPFSGLDPVNLELLKGIILSLREEGKTVIFSTHVMHEAERLCDRILLIDHGRAVLDGTLDEIRAGSPENVVLAELEGEADFVGSLPMVMGVRPNGRRVEIAMREGADPQELLRALLDRTRVRSFEVKRPSLHEIFVERVSGNHA
jgi:ABC-2 type transport system ATP-binding protein